MSEMLGQFLCEHGMDACGECQKLYCERIATLKSALESQKQTVLADLRLIEALKAEISELRAGLAQLEITCDCHTWPTWKEMHAYVDAVERLAVLNAENEKVLKEAIQISAIAQNKQFELHNENADLRAQLTLAKEKLKAESK